MNVTLPVNGNSKITGSVLVIILQGNIFVELRTNLYLCRQLWKEAQAQGDFTIESLTERLCEEYDVTNEEARSSVADILGKWDKEGVIEK